VSTPPKMQDQLAYPPRGMNADRAAAYLGLGKTKFLELVGAGRMPRPVDMDNGTPRWDRLDLDAAFDDLKDCRRDPVKHDRERLHELLDRQTKGDDDED
jgi:predicted DNA-binding transcriptional regulator AlpA